MLYSRYVDCVLVFPFISVASTPRYRGNDRQPRTIEGMIIRKMSPMKC